MAGLVPVSVLDSVHAGRLPLILATQERLDALEREFQREEMRKQLAEEVRKRDEEAEEKRQRKRDEVMRKRKGQV